MGEKSPKVVTIYGRLSFPTFTPEEAFAPAAGVGDAFVEQVAIDCLHLQRPWIDRLDFATQVLDVPLKQPLVKIRIELGVFVAGDQQRRREQRHGVVIEPRE